jgi:Chaperone of endosialidase
MMALEDLTGPDKFITALVETNPEYQDDRRQGDDHLRGVKNVLLNTLPNANAAITAAPARLNGALNNGDAPAFAAIAIGGDNPADLTLPTLQSLDGGGGSVAFAVRVQNAAAVVKFFQFLTDGWLIAEGFQSVSDARLKSSIERIEPAEARAMLDRLSAYRYTIGGRESIGLLAQEVATVAPEAVGMSDEKYLSLDYNAIVALLVAARG